MFEQYGPIYIQNPADINPPSNDTYVRLFVNILNGLATVKKSDDTLQLFSDFITGGGGGSFWIVNGNTEGVIKSIGTQDAFDFPIITNNIEAARFSASDQRFYIGQTGPNNSSNAGMQLASLIGNRSQMRGSQYGANATGGGISTFKSRGLVINGPLLGADAVLAADILRSDSAVGLTGNGSIPIAYLMQVVAVQSTALSVACDWEIQLCPIDGVTNSRRKVFAVTSEGIQRVRESVNTMAGLAVLDAAGRAVIANINVKATTRFLVTVQDGGAAPVGVPYIETRINSTSFSILSNAGAADVGVQVYYQLYEQLT